MSENPVSSWDKEVEEVSTLEGGGDLFGHIRMSWGYKLFVAGVPNLETFFPYDKADKSGKSKEEALAKYKAAIVKYGKEVNKINTSFNFWILKEDVVGRDVSSWTTDAKFYSHPVWTAGFTEIVLPSLRKLEKAGLLTAYTKEAWGKIVEVPDPSGKTKDSKTEFNDDGTPKKQAIRVGFISQIFASREECLKAYEKAHGEAEQSSTVSVEDEIKQCKKDDPDITLFSLATIFDMDAQKLAGILGLSRKDMDAEVAKLKEYGATAEEVAKFYGTSVTLVKKAWA